MKRDPAVLAAAFDDARRLLGQAVEYRRNHPWVFYRYHLRQAATYGALPGAWARTKAWWHRQWRRHYYAKALATDEGITCSLAASLEGGGAHG